EIPARPPVSTISKAQTKAARLNNCLLIGLLPGRGFCCGTKDVGTTCFGCDWRPISSPKRNVAQLEAARQTDSRRTLDGFEARSGEKVEDLGQEKGDRTASRRCAIARSMLRTGTGSDPEPIGSSD